MPRRGYGGHNSVGQIGRLSIGEVVRDRDEDYGRSFTIVRPVSTAVEIFERGEDRLYGSRRGGVQSTSAVSMSNRAQIERGKREDRRLFVVDRWPIQ